MYLAPASRLKVCIAFAATRDHARCSNVFMTAQTDKRRVLALFALAGFLAAALLLIPDSGGADELQRASAVKIGKTKSSPKPTCPTPDAGNVPVSKECQALGRVTGFQTRADGRRGPFKVRQNGHIVAWSVKLSRPNKQERNFFETALSKSGPPAARISILKPRKGGKFKLMKQSPVIALQSSLGSTPTFTLTDPLKVKKGQIVAITATTWISNLADYGAARDDSWKASRNPGECGSERGDSAEANENDLLKLSRPQQKARGKRFYSCTYTGARLMYWAYLAPGG